MMKQFLAGLALLRNAALTVAKNPIHAAAIVAAAVITALVEVLWGTAYTWVGWLDARERMRSEGLVALGSVLAPKRARSAYGDGVWRGLWRVHGVSLALSIIQLPLTVIAFLPAFLAFWLLQPMALLYPHPWSLVLGQALPGLIAAACLAVVSTQTMLALRMLGATDAEHTLGLVFRVVGATWKAALADLPRLIGLGMALVVVGVIGGAIIAGSTALASALDLGGGALVVTTWTMVLVGLLVFAVVLEAVASWADVADMPSVQVTGGYVFTDWLVGWLGAVFGWFAKQGFVAVGTGVTLTVGVLTAVLALMSGQTFTSWVGLGWFAVTAAVLVTLHLAGRRA